MNETSGRLALPFIMPGQAQKEMTHNEALARIDIAAARSVLGVADVPPDWPVVGDCWIVGLAGAGDWEGQGAALAAWTDGGWRFVAPWPGLSVWVADRGCEMRFLGEAWQVGDIVGERLMLHGRAMLGGAVPYVALPGDGMMIDSEARATLEAVIAALQQHGLLSSAENL